MTTTQPVNTEAGGTHNPPGLILKISVVIVGLLVTGILSIGTDALMKVVGVFSFPMTNPMFGIATVYRLIFAILGCYVTARIAPSSPMKYAIILGVVGLALSVVGLMTALSVEGTEARALMGPMWYPIVLVVTAIPCAWVGGKIRLMQLQKS